MMTLKKKRKTSLKKLATIVHLLKMKSLMKIVVMMKFSLTIIKMIQRKKMISITILKQILTKL